MKKSYFNSYISRELYMKLKVDATLKQVPIRELISKIVGDYAKKLDQLKHAEDISSDANAKKEK